MIRSLDHFVLTVADIDATIAFDGDVLGMTPTSFGKGRRALIFGDQKVNLHQAGAEIEPKARKPSPGSADLCFVLDCSLREAAARLEDAGVQSRLARLAAPGHLDLSNRFIFAILTGISLSWHVIRDRREPESAPSRRSAR